MGYLGYKARFKIEDECKTLEKSSEAEEEARRLEAAAAAAAAAEEFAEYTGEVPDLDFAHDNF